MRERDRHVRACSVCARAAPEEKCLPGCCHYLRMKNPQRKRSSFGLLNNYRYLCKKAVKLRAMEDAAARRKRQRAVVFSNRMKRKSTDHSETLGTNKLVKQSHQDSARVRNPVGTPEHSAPPTGASDPLRESWEVDSGFSETSPPASGRSSPCLCSTTVVALDCEMVGTGPGGRCSELARCSILDYHGNVLYDKYVQPSQRVTNFRTPWSGIRSHHLHNARHFCQAREEILAILEGKVVVGHSVYNDFEALDILHPGHMVRDTSTNRLLSRLAGFPRMHRPSLKILASKLLHRKIQVGRRGHCSVEDARAALDLYKLVEGEWEQQLHAALTDEEAPPSFAASNHYMQDEYWPCDVIAESQ